MTTTTSPSETREVAEEVLRAHQVAADRWAMFVDAVMDDGIWADDRRKITRQLQAALGTMSKCACPGCEYVFQQLTAKWWRVHFTGAPHA